MGKKIRVKRPLQENSTGTGTESLPSITLGSNTYTVGEEVLVLHYSSPKWVPMTLKEIKVSSSSGNPLFYFYSSPPGWISVDQDRVKPVPAKKIRLRRSK